jgi:hypothetical protein
LDLVATQLSFNNLLRSFIESVAAIPDPRDLSKKTQYSVYEICGSAFAMMYFQDPSLDHFQRRLKEETNKSNLETMFQVKNIPQQKRMRTFIDKIKPEYFHPAFTDVIKQIKASKALKQFEFNGKFLCPVDGTQYFCTKCDGVSCKHCLIKNHRNGTKTYSHSVVVPMIVHPSLKQVLPLVTEEIRNEDGAKKQDCEINASKRLIPKLKRLYPDLPLVIMGDGLYAKQTLIDLITENNYDYMLVVSPDYNTGFLEEVERRREVGRIATKEFCKSGKHYCYEWSSEIGFKKTGETTDSNYIALTITDVNTEKVTYKNTWATNLAVSEKNIVDLVTAARSRWKVENEGFNILKNHDYELEHNYGHGEENLAFNFFQLTLLSHLYHQAHELNDKLYLEVKEKKETKKNFWDSIRSAIRNILFDCWEDLFRYLLNPPRMRFDPKSQQLIPDTT